MKPAAKIIARAPKRIPWSLVLLAVAGGIALVIWNGQDTRIKPSPAPTIAANPIVQPAVVSAPTVRKYNVEIDTDALRGNGITVAEWLQKIAGAAPNQIRFSPEELITSLPPLRICEYDGDASLTVGEALDLLRYAGLAATSIENPKGYEIRWADSRTQISGDLTSAIDPNSLTWGALRSWQHVTLKLDPTWRAVLGEKAAPPNIANVRAIAWAVQGEICSIDIGADGLIASNRSSIPTSSELDAAMGVLTLSLDKPELAFDSAVGLAALANTDSPPKLPSRTEQALRVLTGGLNAKNLETRRMAAWALGQTTDVRAIEALVDALHNADCPALLVSAALVALAHAEKSGRRLQATTLGSESASRRQAAYQRLRSWLALPHLTRDGNPPDAEYAAAVWATAESFQVDLSLPHLQDFQSQRNLNLPTDSLTYVAGPRWLHVPFESRDALKMFRTGERRNILAALWRWNRPGADSPTALAVDNTDSMLADSIKVILRNSPSATQRRLALEALFRPSDARQGGESKALCDDPGLALNVFLSDPTPAVQRSAGVIVGKSAGIVQLHSLIQAELGARPPAGTDQLLKGLVRRFWMENAEAEETSVVLAKLVDQLLAAEDTHVAEHAAWAKMQNPNLDVSEKLRAAKAMARPSLRAVALKSIAISRMPVEVHSKLIDVFLYDNATTVREAVFSAHLPQLVNHGTERTKLYARGLQDQDASVRLAVLNSRLAIAADSRDALNERVKLLAVADPSQEVRTAAAAWLSGATAR